ncbi:hypothetical protein QBC34DRAFT_419355 [Podospora aff. communis PSN243]|uniref:Uncharacterized protein n=1 Tax=Podospora aff. communis PSN243 TaxID=3040156 RepID=A0AAV9G3J7_9PEZI|nr:hypothetical protein QBC34DRAFT_419355 [Podospora aff. communis PSN243]
MPLLTVAPLAYQSGDLSFSQWMTLFTLCLAPIIAHIIAGAPEPTYLCRSRPKWHERMCIYSPFTILWRYAAITDRRIRALHWSPSDLAAANAIFWTSHGWDGSEEMAARSVQYCVRLPDHSRMTLFSSDSIKTIIVTLQGIQAIFLNGPQAYKTGGNVGFIAQWHAGVSFGNITSVLALYGLLRLFAAFWITDEFSYVSLDDIPLAASRAWAISSDSLQIQTTETDVELLVQSQHDGDQLKMLPTRFMPTSIWSRIFRFAYVSLFSAPILVFLARIFLLQDRDLQVSVSAMASIASMVYFWSPGVGYKPTMLFGTAAGRQSSPVLTRCGIKLSPLGLPSRWLDC